MWLWGRKRVQDEEGRRQESTPPVPAPEISTPPECPRCQSLDAKVGPLLAKCRDNVREQVQDVKHTSEKEIMAIGENVQSIVNNTRQYVEESKDTAINNLADQGQFLSDYLAFSKQATEAQGNTVQEALKLSEEITNAGQAVDKLANQARLLALNAKIEAARLGSSGSAFGVITEEMNHLSLEIAKANGMISESTQAIQSCLPMLAENSASQMERLEQFSHTMQELKSGIEESISEANTAGDSRIQEVLNQAYEVLSHLQFQDPMIQSVQKIDSLVRELSDELVKALNLTVTPSDKDVGPVENLGDKFAEPSNDSEIGPDAGEVMLF